MTYDNTDANDDGTVDADVDNQSVSTDDLKTAEYPVANIKAYGAVGDGSTDDSAAINAAIDAVRESNGVVYVPRSDTSYRASGLTIPSEGITIKSESKQTFIEAPAGATEPVFVSETVSGVDGVEFHNVGIDGSNEGVHGIDLSNIDSLTEYQFQNVFIRNCDRGINGSQNDREGPVDNCKFKNCNVGYYVTENHPYIKDTIFEECGTGVGGDPYHMPVEGSLFELCDYGIRPLDGGEVRNSRIQDTRFTFQSETDLTISSSNQISDCQFNAGVDSVKTAIRIEGSGNDVHDPAFESSGGSHYDRLIGLDLSSNRFRINISNPHTLSETEGMFIEVINGAGVGYLRWFSVDGGVLDIKNNQAINIPSGNRLDHGGIKNITWRQQGDTGSSTPFIKIADTDFGYSFKGHDAECDPNGTVGFFFEGDADKAQIRNNNVRRSDGFNFTSTDTDTDTGNNNVHG